MFLFIPVIMLEFFDCVQRSGFHLWVWGADDLWVRGADDLCAYGSGTDLWLRSGLREDVT